MRVARTEHERRASVRKRASLTVADVGPQILEGVAAQSHVVNSSMGRRAGFADDSAL